MSLTQAFASTQVKFDKSMAEIDRLLQQHAIREFRYTHLRPEKVPENRCDKGADYTGRIIYEFIKGHGDDRRGVRVKVAYEPRVGPYGGKAGATAEMAARALFWFLKAKFDAIDYGIEEFDVAFMPHLMTALGGPTIAEQPVLIAEIAGRPESVFEMGYQRPALPAPSGVIHGVIEAQP